MTYEELKAAYEAAVQKCSELEKENDELKKSNEDQALHIEHLEEQILKRNKMLFEQKSEKSKFICDGQMNLDGNVFNEAEELSNLSAAEPTEDSITKKSKKTGKHRGRNELRGDLETKEIVHTLPEDQRKCAVCGSKLVPFSKEYITTRLCIIPAKIFKITYFREVYKCEHCDKHGDKANIVKAPNLTPAPVIPRGLPEAELIAYIAEAKYLLGEPLYRMEQHFKMQGIYLNRTSLANWIIKSSEWLIPVVKHFWKYAYLEPVLNADETTLRVLKIQGKPVKKLGQMWVVCTGASAKLLIAIYTYRDSRSKVTAEELLGSYDGIVQTDGLGSYGSGDYLHAGCWSHARRKFVDSIPENDKNSKAAKAVEIIDRAFALEREARKANVPPEKILEMRQKEVRPIIEEFYNFIGTLRASKGSHLGAAVTYALNQKDKLLLFLDHPEVEMTNNLAERTVKPFVIDRKNFLFFATDKGADASALFMSVIETAKRNGLNVFGYLSYRQISDTIEGIYGFEVSDGMVSDITDRLLPQIEDWQNRPLDAVYPIVFIDAAHFSVRDNGQIRKLAAYVILAVSLTGHKEVLSIHIGENESAKYWLGVLNELKNRGVKDVLVICADGLSGMKEAINAAFPQTELQRCIVHQVRNTLKYVGAKNKKEFANDLKTIYHAPSEDAALKQLERVTEKWEKDYPNAMKSWYKNWDVISPIFKFSADVRKVIYTTNAIESLNSGYRRLNKQRSVFPSDTALLKALYLATHEITKKWTMPLRNWGRVLGELEIMYPDRLTVGET